MKKIFAWMMKLLENVSEPVSQIFEEIGAIFVLLGQLLKACFKLAMQPARFRTFYYNAVLEQMIRIGVDSIPVVLTTALCTGMVLAVQTGVTLEAKLQGSSVFIGSIVTLSLVRELGPVLTAILVTGRVGSAMAAEIGSMKITEQIDALRTLAANPVEYIGVPRFIGVLVMIPMLTIMADVIGTLGGWVVASATLGLNSNVFWDGAITTVQSADILSGLLKSFFFAVILCVFALRRGFTTEGGAVGVGRSTTGAVVNASITILIFDYFLTQLFAVF